MKFNKSVCVLGMALALSVSSVCIQAAETTASGEKEASAVASPSEMTTVVDVVEDWMVPVPGTELLDGTYSVTVDSSSSMFSIASCELTVSDGEMTADLTMGSSSFLYLYPGSGEEAASASESEYISYTENEEGAPVFTLPVEALDAGIPCAAFSRKKEKWYDRTLVFRADSLPADAWKESPLKTVSDLGLEDGTYTAEVILEGGSGKASVESPAEITVQGESCTAKIVWSSSKYDFMVVDGAEYLPLEGEETSVFEIPVSGFDAKLAVQADTTAMSQPYLIDYTLTFDSGMISAAE